MYRSSSSCLLVSRKNLFEVSVVRLQYVIVVTIYYNGEESPYAHAYDRRNLRTKQPLDPLQ